MSAYPSQRATAAALYRRIWLALSDAQLAAGGIFVREARA